jgi:hypothetical protein
MLCTKTLYSTPKLSYVLGYYILAPRLSSATHRRHRRREWPQIGRPSLKTTRVTVEMRESVEGEILPVLLYN